MTKTYRCLCEFCGEQVEYPEYRNSNIKDYFLCYFCAVGYDLHLEEEDKEKEKENK